MTFPNVIIIGVPKAGTSSVFSWLVDHPEVVGSSVKETHYFDDPGTHRYDNNNNFLSGGLEGYSKYFPEVISTGVKWVLEATPAYFYSKNALDHLALLPTRPKLIVILREPSDQIYSLFQYFKNNWQYIKKSMNFSEFIDAVKKGEERFGDNELLINCLNNVDYYSFLSKWMDKYGGENMLICFYEDLKSDENKFMKNICEFLSIDFKFYENYRFSAENVTYKVRVEFIQKLNIFIRAYFPKGFIYKYAKKIYRYINTEKKSTSEHSLDLKAKNNLKNELNLINKNLKSIANIDSRWNL